VRVRLPPSALWESWPSQVRRRVANPRPGSTRRRFESCTLRSVISPLGSGVAGRARRADNPQDRVRSPGAVLDCPGASKLVEERVLYTRAVRVRILPPGRTAGDGRRPPNGGASRLATAPVPKTGERRKPPCEFDSRLLRFTVTTSCRSRPTGRAPGFYPGLKGFESSGRHARRRWRNG
jgi:hypothetical protein